MLTHFPKIARWLGVFCLLLAFLGAHGRVRITGEGITRDRELFFGLLDQLRPASFIDLSILVTGICGGIYLLFFSYYLKRLLQLGVRSWWLQLHIMLIFLLIAAPFLSYQGWGSTSPDRPNYSERFLPSLDDLTGHAYNISLEVDFVIAASYVYALFLSVLLTFSSLIVLCITTRKDVSSTEITIEDHLLE